MTALHKNLPNDEIHTVVAWVYATEAARLAATGFVAADLYKLAYQTDTGTLFVLQNYSPITWMELAAGSGQLLNKVELLIRNETGSTILKGKCVYASGWSVAEGRVLVALADKADPDKRPAIGVTNVEISNNANGTVLAVGRLEGVDTSSWSLTDQLVLGTNGALSRPPPDVDPFTGEIQNMGVVARVDGSNGHIIILTDGLQTVTADDVFALAGTSGTPSKTNKFVTNADSRNTDARTPLTHAPSHKSGGSDSVKLDELAAPTDITTLNADVSKHGLLPKLGGGTTNFLRADGTWASPAVVFGQNAQGDSSESESTTTSSTYQRKLRLTTTSLPAGTYRIEWYFEWRYDGISDDFMGRVRLDDLTNLAEINIEAHDILNYSPESGFIVVALSAASHTIDIDFASEDNSTTARIRRARINLYRVS